MNVSPESTGPDDGRRRPYDKTSREVGEAIRRARLEAGLSQTELGKMLRTRNGTAVPRTKISSYERGQYIPEERLRPQFAKALDVEEENLFYGLAAQGDQPTEIGRLGGRVARLERELDTLREQFNQHLNAQAAGLAAREANRADRESRKAPKRSRGRRASKGDRD